MGDGSYEPSLLSGIELGEAWDAVEGNGGLEILHAIEDAQYWRVTRPRDNILGAPPKFA